MRFRRIQTRISVAIGVTVLGFIGLTLTMVEMIWPLEPTGLCFPFTVMPSIFPRASQVVCLQRESSANRDVQWVGI